MANTWGYGAMTNSYNDIRNAKTMIIMGGNPAEAHPVSLQHVLEGKELNRANMIVIDPRMTRTAAHATEYVRIRSGTDIPVIWGMLWHIFKNGWEDKEFIQQRVYGMDDIRKEVEKWTPDEVERVTGVPGAQLERVAKMFATEKPATLIWCMGATQHTVGTANVRAFCIALLATGNVGEFGTGANIFRGHTNVQGATDLGLDIVTLPLYYGLVEGAWRHWCRVWEVDYDWLQGRFDTSTAPDGKPVKMMNTPGIPSTRWFDATLYDKDQVSQKDNLKAMMIFGPRRQHRDPHAGSREGHREARPAGRRRSASDHLGGARPSARTTPTCCRSRTSYETDGSRTASNRSIQWGEQIVKPIFESKDDNEVMYLLAKKLGFADRMFKNIKVENNVPVAEDILREINRGGWSTGYCGQSPERLKAHMKNQDKFDLVTLRAPKDLPEIGGDYYGLPWPCWGTPELRHPGTHTLYNTNLHVKDGGGTFRARFGVERVVKTKVMENGSEVEKEVKHNLLAEGSYSQGLGDQGRLSGVHARRAEEARLGQGPDRGRDGGDPAGQSRPIRTPCPGRSICRAASSASRSKHGCIHYGNGKARANAFGLPDAIPVHREPIYTPRPDLVAKYPTLPNARQFRMPNVGFDVQKAAVEKGIAKQFPLILTSGRLVEYEGGGEETRSNKWLAELQQDMFIEINPADAAERGIKDGGWVWVTGAENSTPRRG